MVVSTVEWIPSEIIEELLVYAPAMNFVNAINKLAASAL
ncbi:conserved hypothetical protein [Chryseobacterium sp. 8AT]|nr:conserved hypothetical protein [Chryseobacterium sp. 8AT]